MARLHRMGQIGFLLGLGLLLASAAEARVEIGDSDLEVSGELFNYFEVRWGGKSGPEQLCAFTDGGGPPLCASAFTPSGPLFGGFPVHLEKYENVNAMRTELLIEAAYRGIPHLTPVIKLRPFYDAAFDLEDEEASIYNNWQSNLYGEMEDEWDPIVREAYVDLNFHPFFLRAGRQIVTWGRSDGVVVLDQVNPRNYRNPLTFEQERFQIPQWMMNFTWDMSGYDAVPGGIQKELQVIWNMEYLPSRFAGFEPGENGQHPWNFNVIDLANQVVQVSRNLFSESNFYSNEYDDGDFWKNSEVFVRWRGRTGTDLGPLSDMTYSFHYGHLYNDLPFYELKTRIDAGLPFDIAGPRAAGGGIDFEKRRYDLVGFSFDKALMFLPGQFEGTVLRGEIGYSIGDSYYEPDFNLKHSNAVTTLIGLDQYLYLSPRSWIETPWFVSFQIWHDYITRGPGDGDFLNEGSVSCDLQPGCGDRGYVTAGAFNLFNGLRDQDRTVFTLYMFNDFLPGKTLRVELFGLHELNDGGSWFRGVVGYNFNSWASMRVGTNLVWGARDGFFGEFEKNDTIFTELKFTF